MKRRMVVLPTSGTTRPYGNALFGSWSTVGLFSQAAGSSYIPRIREECTKALNSPDARQYFLSVPWTPSVLVRGRWYLIVVSTFTFPMTRSLFSHAYWPSVHLLGETFTRLLCLFLNWVIIFSLLIRERSLHIRDTGPFSEMMGKYFLLVLCVAFSLPWSWILKHTRWPFWWGPSSFSLVVYGLGALPKKPLPDLRWQWFTSVFF